ncbi:hypothetical protein B0T21DRAFT_353688 [Apiosordaria backusii]|uniref:Uncharacterized protein n=1 Tax=Apiosordaria backusii TaxID=314023 RepID=A0AA40DFD6_9PEZI|nr:hypothetical protein B0T21DRAFT_353688 [Apiosordaria backusii]
MITSTNEMLYRRPFLCSGSANVQAGAVEMSVIPLGVSVRSHNPSGITAHTEAFTLGRAATSPTNPPSNPAANTSNPKQCTTSSQPTPPAPNASSPLGKPCSPQPLKQKSKNFTNLDDYLNFRIIDTGAPFVEATMLVGMGLILPSHDKEWMDEITRPCFASLALANEYFT